MPHDELLNAAVGALRAPADRAADVRRWFVPGRLEVLGKHTDYAGGRSLLCAAERGIVFASLPRSDDRLRIVDARSGEELDFAIGPALRSAAGHWANYPMTVARRVARNFPGPLKGADVAFASDLPPAAGMSSSSALVVGFFTVLAEANDLASRAEYAGAIRGPHDLAAYLGAVENGKSFDALPGDTGVGTSGGTEDHTAILCCRPGQLSQYAFCPTRHQRSIPLLERWVFAVAASGVVADKNAAARESYNRAAHAVDLVMQAWRSATGRADLFLADALASSADAPDRMREILRAAPLAPVAAKELHDRVEQFLAESTEIIPEVGDCLARGDVEGIGLLVDRSQRMAERLLRNQVPETVGLAHQARERGAAAASAFGAGFGGAVWALVQRNEADAFLEGWASAYKAAFPQRAPRCEFFLTRPGPGMTKL